jgi:3'(2'), 5'-bisphosphate nucleotidase
MKLLNTQIYALLQKLFQVSEYLLKMQFSIGNVDFKEDRTPVTNIDKAASEMIIMTLKDIFPNVPIVSEEDDENISVDIIRREECFFVIDPIDGTWSYIKGASSFAINIALIVKGAPLYGFLAVPAERSIYFTNENMEVFVFDSEGMRKVEVNYDYSNGLDFLISHSKMSQKLEEYLSQSNVRTLTAIPSAVKFALMLEGLGHIYPRFAPTSIWDTAAGHALLNAIGGDVIDEHGNSLRYNKDLRNPHFIAKVSKKI